MGEADEETVGQRIQRLREEKGLTQRDLAVDGVNHGTISKIERGVRSATRATLSKIAVPLGVTAYYLEHGIDPMQLLRDAQHLISNALSMLDDRRDGHGGWEDDEAGDDDDAAGDSPPGDG